MAGRLYADKRGISPVVATVILVAVTIVVAVAVAYWMGGLTSVYTRFEKLEITSAYAQKNDGTFTITLNIKNSGSADATIDNILLNGKPPSEYEVNNITDSNELLYNGTSKEWMKSLSVKAGASATIIICVNATAPFTSGTSIEIRLHTAAGQEYPKQVTLP